VTHRLVPLAITTTADPRLTEATKPRASSTWPGSIKISIETSLGIETVVEVPSVFEPSVGDVRRLHRWSDPCPVENGSLRLRASDTVRSMSR